MSATTTSPHRPRPGSSTCAGFLAWKVTVRAAWGAKPSGAPVSPPSPEGRSTATRAAPLAVLRRRAAWAEDSSGRARPAPNRASITSPSAGASALGRERTSPVQAAAAAAASPFSPARSPRAATPTGHPAWARRRAATQPSPPLFPGPHSTTTGRGDHRAATASATAVPARSMSRLPGTPLSIAAASAARVSATVRISCVCPIPSAMDPRPSLPNGYPRRLGGRSQAPSVGCRPTRRRRLIDRRPISEPMRRRGLGRTTLEPGSVKCSLPPSRGARP